MAYDCYAMQAYFIKLNESPIIMTLAHAVMWLGRNRRPLKPANDIVCGYANLSDAAMALKVLVTFKSLSQLSQLHNSDLVTIFTK